MDRKHLKTLKAIYEKPERANIHWQDIESLFHALGAEISEGSGSRIRIALNGVRAVFIDLIHKKKQIKVLLNLSADFSKQQE